MRWYRRSLELASQLRTPYTALLNTHWSITQGVVLWDVDWSGTTCVIARVAAPFQVVGFELSDAEIRSNYGGR
jgi:hypothetical protein